MPVHHRLRFLTFPMRTSRLCSLWPDMRPLRFRRVPFGRDVAFDPGGATASRIAMPHMLPSTVPSASASRSYFFRGSIPHPIQEFEPPPSSRESTSHRFLSGALQTVIAKTERYIAGSVAAEGTGRPAAVARVLLFTGYASKRIGGAGAFDNAPPIAVLSRWRACSSVITGPLPA